MGVAIRISFRDLDRLGAKIDALGSMDPAPLLDAVGSLVESQTRARIAEGGPAPDGTPWAPWSEAYAKTRHAGQGILFSEGFLLASISHQVEGDGVAVFAERPGAKLHQFGGEIVQKARSGTLRLRTTGSRGKLLRQGTTAPLSNLAVFARSSGSHPHAHFTERLFEVAQHVITMPARPYLGLSESNEAEVTDLAAGFVERILQ